MASPIAQSKCSALVAPTPNGQERSYVAAGLDSGRTKHAKQVEPATPQRSVAVPDAPNGALLGTHCTGGNLTAAFGQPTPGPQSNDGQPRHGVQLRRGAGIKEGVSSDRSALLAALSPEALAKGLRTRPNLYLPILSQFPVETRLAALSHGVEKRHLGRDSHEIAEGNRDSTVIFYSNDSHLAFIYPARPSIPASETKALVEFLTQHGSHEQIREFALVHSGTGLDQLSLEDRQALILALMEGYTSLDDELAITALLGRRHVRGFEMAFDRKVLVPLLERMSDDTLAQLFSEIHRHFSPHVNNVYRQTPNSAGAFLNEMRNLFRFAPIDAGLKERLFRADPRVAETPELQAGMGGVRG